VVGLWARKTVDGGEGTDNVICWGGKGVDGSKRKREAEPPLTKKGARPWGGEQRLTGDGDPQRKTDVVPVKGKGKRTLRQLKSGETLSCRTKKETG